MPKLLVTYGDGVRLLVHINESYACMQKKKSSTFESDHVAHLMFIRGLIKTCFFG